MDNKLLEQAVKVLQIKGIYLFASQSQLSETFFPAYDSSVNELKVQFKHEISNCQTVSFSDGEEEPLNILRFHAECGARMLGCVDNDDQKALIEATFVAEYALTGDLAEEAVTEFALRNVMFNVWPYWREYLTSTCDRIGLPKVFIPFMQRAQNCPELTE